MIEMRLFQQAIEYPSKVEPSWAPQVERWYQLDAAAFGLAQAYSKFREQLKESCAEPSFLFLASPGASNETDFQFVQTGASSPSKFVHTLPSVRAVSLLQVMNWQGPVLCLQSDPKTFLKAISEALSFISDENPLIWILSIQPSPESHVETHLFDVALAELSYDTVKKKNLTPKTETFLIESPNREENKPSQQLTIDLDFWNWLRKKNASAFISQNPNLRICRQTQ